MLAKLKAAMPLGAIRVIHRLQARVLPPAPQTFQLIGRYCRGQGLEIGPGLSPYCDPKTTMFLEKHPQAANGYRSAQIVADANEIPVPDERFDYLFSSHVLEHMPDTVRTLKEWRRVLKPGGVLFLVLPHGDRTFDRGRQKTPLDHHLRDHETLNGQRDHSHFGEALAGYRASGEPMTADPHAIMADNVATDLFHYHVWTQNEIVRLVQHLGWGIAAVAESVADRDDSFVVVARKP
jgi:SAM-dependent methyltransferase